MIFYQNYVFLQAFAKQRIKLLRIAVQLVLNAEPDQLILKSGDRAWKLILDENMQFSFKLRIVNRIIFQMVVISIFEGVGNFRHATCLL